MLQPAGGLELVEQVVAAHEHALGGGQRVFRGPGLGWGRADLVEGLVERRLGAGRAVRACGRRTSRRR